MPQTNVARPGRPLLAFFLLLGLVYAGIAVAGTLTPQLGLDLQGGTSITLSAQTVDGSEPSQESLDEAVSIIRQRVNGSGVAEAEVTTQGVDTIIVQVPGVNQDELVALVGQTAELQFRPVQAIVSGTSPAAVPDVAPTDEATPSDDATLTEDDVSLGEPRATGSDRASRADVRLPLSADATEEVTPGVAPEPVTTAAQPAAEDLAALLEFDCDTIEPGRVTPADETLIT